MADSSKSKPLLALALWYLSLAVKILQHLCRLGGTALSEPAARNLVKTDALIADPSKPFTVGAIEAVADPPQPPLSLRDKPTPEQSRGEDFLTVDRVEIRGRLGTNDHRELKINNMSPIRLDRREHAVLLILAWLARCAVLAPATSKKPLPAFMPVKTIVAIIDRLTAERGPLAGRWPYAMETDIYRWVNKLRRRLKERGLNPNLIESGQRLAGYRISTPVGRIILDATEQRAEKFWADLFDSVLHVPGGSGEEG